MKTTKLKLDYDYEFILIGILATVPDYKLCWEMNKVLELILTKEDDLELPVSPLTKANEPELNFKETQGTPYFSLHTFYDDVRHLNYTVVANKSQTSLLIKEEQSVDFFLIIDGVYENDLSSHIVEQIRSMETVITAYEIDPNRLKSKQNLIFN